MAPPRKAHPRTEFVTLRLTTDEAADLDTLAQRQGLSRSQTVRAAVARVIAAESRKRARDIARADELGVG